MGAKLAWLVVALTALSLGGCISTSPSPTVVVPPGSTVVCPNGSPAVVASGSYHC